MNETAMRATIIACWDALEQARAHIAGDTPEMGFSKEDADNAVLEMILEAIEDCRRTMR